MRVSQSALRPPGVAELCASCHQRLAQHSSAGPDGTRHSCCACWVADYNSPADWHPHCVRAYEERKTQARIDERAPLVGILRITNDGQVERVGRATRRTRINSCIPTNWRPGNTHYVHDPVDAHAHYLANYARWNRQPHYYVFPECSDIIIEQEKNHAQD